LPLIKNDEEKSTILEYCGALHNALQTQDFHDGKIRVKIDASDGRPGEKAWGWVKKGVPIRIEVGNREVENNNVSIGRRDCSYADKIVMSKEEFVNKAVVILNEIQSNLLTRAQQFKANNMQTITSKDDFYDYFSPNNKTQAGFAIAPWADDAATEEMIKKDLKVTPRCVPLVSATEQGKCIFTGKQAAPITVFAKAY
jgi:prolyl-tRNA synthetase